MSTTAFSSAAAVSCGDSAASSFALGAFEADEPAAAPNAAACSVW
jgi:hypothetical protein